MTEEDIYRLQNEHGLTYHVSYALQADQMVGLKGGRILEVGGSLPQTFVFRDLGVRQWVSLHEMDYWTELPPDGGGTRPPLSATRPLESIKPTLELKAYEVLTGRIEDLPECFVAKFDVVFSIAAFEHILRLPT